MYMCRLALGQPHKSTYVGKAGESLGKVANRLDRLLGPIFGMIGRRHNHADVRKLKAILEGTS